MPLMFKPKLDNFSTTLGDHSPNFGDLVRLESAIKRKRQIVEPDFALTPRFEHVHVHTLYQIIAVEADPVPVLDKDRRHLQSAGPTSPSLGTGTL